MEKLNETPENQFEKAETEKNENDLKWDNNHEQINSCITQHLLTFGTMPGKSQIAEGTGLSRPTINKHLRSYVETPFDDYDDEAFDLMMTKQVTTEVLKAALRGDLNAARLFLETSRWQANARNERKKQNDPENRFIHFDILAGQRPNPQNNYLQINKTIINQRVIQQLKPEQLDQIEQIIAAELDKYELP